MVLPKNFTGKNYDKVFIQHCLKGDLLKVRDFVNKFIYDSQDLKTMLINSINIIIDSKKIPDELKYKLINLIGECEYRLTISSDFYICSQWLCANTFNVVSEFKEMRK